jgi:aspartate racemase
MTKTIGICAHSYEGGALCFLSACREGISLPGLHMHPPIILSAVPMGLSMPAWDADNLDGVAVFLTEGVEQLAKAGADFFICPDNTAHLVLERIISELPLPGLHIAEVVCKEIVVHGWKKVGLLGTNWTMNGTVYAHALAFHGLEKLVPDEPTRNFIHQAIFDELCMSIFNPNTVNGFISAIDSLKKEGAECVILGCTEIPLIITPENSPLPVLDSTRLLAKYAVGVALNDQPLLKSGWIKV